MKAHEYWVLKKGEQYVIEIQISPVPGPLALTTNFLEAAPWPTRGEALSMRKYLAKKLRKGVVAKKIVAVEL